MVTVAAPLLVRDQNPLNTGSLPLLPQASLPQVGQSRFDFRLNVSNTLNLQGGGAQDEYLILDSETAALDLQWLKRIRHKLLVGVQVPFLHHGPGELDSFIEHYHDLLHLPQGNRPNEPKNRFQILYENGGETRLDQKSSLNGIGDVALLAGFPIVQSSKQSTTVFSRIQFPTGNRYQLTGTGRVNFAGWLATSWKSGDSLEFSGDFGLVAAPDTITPIGEYNDILWFGAGAIQWIVSSKLNLVAQLDAHSQIYKDGGVDLLGNAILLTMGGNLELRPGFKLEVSVAEDIQVNASPDVAIQLGFSILYGR